MALRLYEVTRSVRVRLKIKPAANGEHTQTVLVRLGAFSLIELLVVHRHHRPCPRHGYPRAAHEPVGPGHQRDRGTLEQARAYAMANNTYVYVRVAMRPTAKRP